MQKREERREKGSVNRGEGGKEGGRLGGGRGGGGGYTVV